MSCDRLPLITGGFLNLTQKCNLKCKYCFVHQQPKEMTLETAIDAVNFYAQNAVKEARMPSITLFGGEPMLKYDEIIVPLVKYIRSTYGDYDISITTNGTLLNEDVYKFFKKHDVSMLLSIDGDRDTQNLNRPYHSDKGSFDDIDVDLHLKYYPNAIFRATLDNSNVHNLYKNYLWGESKGYKKAAFIINVFSEWSEEEMAILESDLDKIVNHIKNKIKNGEDYMEYSEINKRAGDYEILQSIDDDYYRDKGQGCLACGTCGLGASYFGSIGSTGDIYSCQEMTENIEYKDFIIGNIYTGVNDDKRFELADKFNTKNVKSEKDDRCKTCKLNKVCAGGCVINNYFKFGTLEKMPKCLCKYYELCLIGYEKLYGGVK